MKIGYFTAGPQPTSNELAEITAYRNVGHDVSIRDVTKYALDTYQPGEFSLEAFDYVDAYAGTTIPEPYDDTELYPVASPSAPPAAHAPLSTQKLITSGVEFLSPAVSGERTDGYTPTIVAGAVTALTGS
jgi:hypothetical protein